MRGILAGALALVALHTLVAYQGPSKRLQDLAGSNGIAVQFVRRFLDPTIPAIGGDQLAVPAGSSATAGEGADKRNMPQYPAPTAR